MSTNMFYEAETSNSVYWYDSKVVISISQTSQLWKEAEIKQSVF